MVTISLCMIVRNEEAVLKRCLDGAREYADEIILVDTGSEDKTRAIAKRYADRVVDFPWRDDFAAARNEAFSHATKDYCMWLDADDVVTAEERAKLARLKERLEPDTDVVMMRYVLREDGQGRSLFSCFRERLIRNRRGFRWVGRVHEVIVPAGKVITEDITIRHRKVKPGDPDRNLRIYEAMIREGEELDGRERFYYGRELMDHGRLEEAEAVFRAFLEGEGWVENRIEACLNRSECLRRLGRKEESARALLGSFLYDTPRGEVCTALGQYFQEEGRYREAAWWYETALGLTPPENGAFTRPDCYGYLPEINLCVCYDRLGDVRKAYEYHRRARERRPEAPEVAWNEAYFQKRFRDEPNLFPRHRIE